MTADSTDRGDETWQRTRLTGSVDFSVMYAAHDAFSRDLRRMTDAVAEGRATDPPVRDGWALFKSQLHVHHVAEDAALWPALRQKVTAADDAAVLDAMVAEHSRIDPLLAQIDAALDATGAGAGSEGDSGADVGGGGDLAAAVAELSEALTGHMQHEEDQALPLIETHLGPKGWAAFARESRKVNDLRGGLAFLPWVLDEASADSAKQVLGLLPPPLRFVATRMLQPSYARRRLWGK